MRVTTGLDTTQTIRRPPGDLALSTFIAPESAKSPQPWIQDHRLILSDLPYADDDEPQRPSTKNRSLTALGKDVSSEPRITQPNPFLRSAVGAVGTGAIRRPRQVVTIISAAVLAVLVYLALQGTLLRPTDPPISSGTSSNPEAAID